MEIKSKDGVDIYALPPCAWCKVAKKDIEDMDACPMCNFDDFGDICVPEICEHYTEDKNEIGGKA